MPNPLQSFAEIKAPPRNKLMGLVADALTRANEFATMQDPRYADKRQNQTLGILADVLSLGSIAKTADRLSYGDPLTNAKKANVPFLKPETADAAMMAPLSPRTALAALGMGMGDNALTRAATVWHGSPHKFDKFDSSKIGTGEGAQAYGHGLYLAESPDVAGSYAAMNQASAPSRASFIRLRDKAPVGSAEWKHYDALANEGIGSLYKVDLPDERIARMLDWDKPLSQQAPEVRRALFNAGIDPAKHGGTGSTLISELTGTPGIKDMPWMGKRESLLREAGIPGIKYLDGGSRGTGTGTSNYVVFPGEEAALKILERNGIKLD